MPIVGRSWGGRERGEERFADGFGQLLKGRAVPGLWQYGFGPELQADRA